MSQATHVLTTNGRISGELKSSFVSERQMIANSINNLDGVKWYSELLWKLPDGVALDRLSREKWAQEYIQVAGSRERLSIEIRRLESGTYAQYVVGRLPGVRDGEPTAVIAWDKYELRVYDDEVFTAKEATQVFVEYWETGAVPVNLSLRRLTL